MAVDQLPNFEGDAGAQHEAIASYEFSMSVPADDADDGFDVSASTSSAATSDAIGATTALIYSDVECFAVAGAAPTATVAKGVPIPAGTLLRVYGFGSTDKLAFITATGTGTVRVRPGL
jgi:hypothetical protein